MSWGIRSSYHLLNPLSAATQHACLSEWFDRLQSCRLCWSLMQRHTIDDANVSRQWSTYDMQLLEVEAGRWPLRRSHASIAYWFCFGPTIVTWGAIGWGTSSTVDCCDWLLAAGWRKIAYSATFLCYTSLHCHDFCKGLGQCSSGVASCQLCRSRSATRIHWLLHHHRVLLSDTSRTISCVQFVCSWVRRSRVWAMHE